MDRGRVGTLAIGNKAIREGMIKHQQEVHMERISKIKNRKPGSSNTLDNTAPVVVKAALNNPRKAALKLEFNTVTERENKVLLQKISAILTAPPKITDEDYMRMKKIVQNLKGGKQMYEEAIAMKHHKIYLKHLKTMGPYYKPKEWELDYRRQLRQQKFMRQVTYTRPKSYVDPLKKQEDEEDVIGPRASSAPLGQNSRSSAHIHRVREVKEVRASTSSLNSGNGGKKASSSSSRDAAAREGRSTPAGGENGYEYDLDHFDNDENIEQEQEQMEELARVARPIRVTSDVATDGGGEQLVVEECMGKVDCWLIDKSILVISASAPRGEQTPAFDAEAEIDVVGLAEMRGISEDKILSDSTQISTLATYIAESVEVRIENGVARVILNLASDDATGGVGAAEGDFSLTGDQDLMMAQSEGDGDYEAFAQDGDEYDNPEADDALVDDITFKSGVTIPVELVFPASKKKQQDLLPVRTKKDCVLAIAEIKLSSEGDDEISIDVQICSNSETKFRGKSAVVADTTMSMKTGLPSIMKADKELLSEYFVELSKHLYISHQTVTGALALLVSSGSSSSAP